MNSCPFCIPDQTRVILSNFHALAISDSFPVSPGHTLIVPKRHVASLFEATREENDALLDLLRQMRQLLQQVRNPASFNIGINDGAAAGQTIMHLHIHLSPHYSGDAGDPRGGVRWIFPDKAVYWNR